MKTEKLIAKLEKMFPESKPVCTVEWDGREGGIWFRGSEDVLADGERVFDHYNVDWNYCMNPQIDRVLDEAGWYAEPYDAGTCMAYPIN